MAAGQTKAAFRVKIVGRIHGQTTNNVLHFRAMIADLVTPESNNSLLQQLLTAIMECVIDTLLPAVTTDWTFIRSEAQMLLPQVTDPIESTAQGNLTGARTNSNVSFCASLVNLRSGVGGRRGRGKIFLPPGGDLDMTNSVLSDDLTDLLEAFLLCMFGKFVGPTKTTPFEWGVLSRKDMEGVTGANAFDAIRPIVNAAPNQVAAKIGSRKLGSGS